MSIKSAVDEILQLHEENGGKFEESAWEQIGRIMDIVPAFPSIPGLLFTRVMPKATPANIEMVIVREGKVLLVKRNFLGDVAYHTPGTYIASGETLLEAAQRCADRELKVKVTSAEQIDGELHPNHPRFPDYSIGVLCEIEGEPKAGEWFDQNPGLLKVQENYWRLFIEPFVGRA